MTTINKNFFIAPSTTGLGAMRWVATLLLAVMMLTMTAQTAWATDVTLSGSDNYTAQDGDVLTGSTSGTVTIAGNASITLNNATISGGIVCEGSATITLVGTNSVSGKVFKAGIQVGGSGTTLTIKGNGSLTANGGSQSAGIGLSRAWDVDATGGDIVIEGGNITATGNNYGAGIGTGVSWGDSSDKTATIGNITIKGGTVRAIGGTNQYFPGSGIGKGGAYSYGHAVVGTITIYDGIDVVDVSSIREIVTYKHGETDVTSFASDYFTINEDGDRRIIVPKDDTYYNVTIDEEITGGTVTADKTTAKAGELVALTVTPESGYVLQSLTVKDASDNDVSLSNREFIMPRSGVTVSATFIQSAFDQETGVLTLKGNVDADEVKAYGAVIGDFGAIVKYSPVTSVVCEPGTVLPADCSEMFMNFYNISDNLTIDLSNADVSGVTNMSKMFGGSLTTIYVNSAWSMENVTSSDQMFYGCVDLKGGNGTRWRYIKDFNGYETAMSSTYAVIDGKKGQKGYLTVKPKQTPSAPTANVITYTGEAQELVTAGDGTMTYSLDGENYSADIPTVTDAGKYTVYYKVEGSDNWNAVEPQTVEVTIAKANITMTTAPAAIENLAYSGSAQTLITAGAASFGTVLYSLDGTNFSDALPQGTNVGTYTVYYKVEGSDNWNAVDVQTVEVNIALALADAADNNAAIDDYAGKTLVVALSGRTLFKDGSWNTLCLPFDVDLTATDCPLYGATARTVTEASISGTTLNLTFGNAVNTLEAGTPYIIRWDGDGTSNIENPVFEGVTISADKHDYDNNVAGDERVRFVGTYKSTAFDAENKSILLMGEENTLYYPAEGAGIGSFRAYFKIGDDDNALLARRLTSFSIDFGEDEEEATGIVEVETNTSLSTLQSSLKDAWHTLDGRRLQGKPTQGGIYIKNGKKITVK